MKSRRRWKKYLSIVTFSLTGIGLIIGLDMALGGSVYHPLTHLYKIGSWLGCKNSTADNCNKRDITPVSGKNGIVVTTQHNASEIGLQILQQGGNAIDAAVAVGYGLAVTDPCCGKVFLVTGSPGGATITTTVLQVITNVIDYDKNIAAAVNAPRFHYQGLPDVVLTEPYTLNSADFQGLWGMGYRVAPFLTWGAAESILTDPKTGLLYGANDSRKAAGIAAAY